MLKKNRYVPQIPTITDLKKIAAFDINLIAESNASVECVTQSRAYRKRADKLFAN